MKGRKGMTAETILMALACIRAPQPQDEYDLHGLVADALQQAEIPFLHEAPLAPRCRIDFLCGEIGIEIKRGRGEKKALEKQLRRYVDSGKITALILVSEKIADVPAFIAVVEQKAKLMPANPEPITKKSYFLTIKTDIWGHQMMSLQT